MKDKHYSELPESLRETIAVTEGLINPVLPIIEEQKRFQECIAPLTAQSDVIKALTTPILPNPLPAIKTQLLMPWIQYVKAV